MSNINFDEVIEKLENILKNNPEYNDVFGNIDFNGDNLQIFGDFFENIFNKIYDKNRIKNIVPYLLHREEDIFDYAKRTVLQRKANNWDREYIKLINVSLNIMQNFDEDIPEELQLILLTDAFCIFPNSLPTIVGNKDDRIAWFELRNVLFKQMLTTFGKENVFVDLFNEDRTNIFLKTYIDDEVKFFEWQIRAGSIDGIALEDYTNEDLRNEIIMINTPESKLKSSEYEMVKNKELNLDACFRIYNSNIYNWIFQERDDSGRELSDIFSIDYPKEEDLIYSYESTGSYEEEKINSKTINDYLFEPKQSKRLFDFISQMDAEQKNEFLKNIVETWSKNEQFDFLMGEISGYKPVKTFTDELALDVRKKAESSKDFSEYFEEVDFQASSSQLFKQLFEVIFNNIYDHDKIKSIMNSYRGFKPADMVKYSKRTELYELTDFNDKEYIKLINSSLGILENYHEGLPEELKLIMLTDAFNSMAHASRTILQRKEDSGFWFGLKNKSLEKMIEMFGKDNIYIDKIDDAMIAVMAKVKIEGKEKVLAWHTYKNQLKGIDIDKYRDVQVRQKMFEILEKNEMIGESDIELLINDEIPNDSVLKIHNMGVINKIFEVNRETKKDFSKIIAIDKSKKQKNVHEALEESFYEGSVINAESINHYLSNDKQKQRISKIVEDMTPKHRREFIKIILATMQPQERFNFLLQGVQEFNPRNTRNEGEDR